MRMHRCLIVFASVAALAPATLTAQGPSNSPPERTGFYGMIGAGYGDAMFETNSVYSNNGAGMYMLTLGYMLDPRWRLGVEMDYVISPDAGSYSFGCCNSTAAYYSASVAYYDDASSHLWFKGNLGYSTYNATYFTGNNPGGGAGMYLPYSNGGIAAGLGIGYDVRLGKGGVLMSPFLSYERQLSTTQLPGVSGASGRQSFLFAGLGVGYNR